ncbi:MAG: GNAT family N-acetyltransferase [Ktedonobacteraceae bacterium]
MSDHRASTSPTGAAIRVRLYHPDDRDFVLSLTPRLTIGMAPWRDPEKMHDAMRGFTMESIAGSSEEAGSNNVVFIAEDERGVPLGFISTAHNVNFTGEIQAYIGELAVSAEAEGRGAGRALISAAEEWALVHNYSIIVLETGAANDRARAFYQRLGYQEESVKLVKVL